MPVTKRANATKPARLTRCRSLAQLLAVGGHRTKGVLLEAKEVLGDFAATPLPLRQGLVELLIAEPDQRTGEPRPHLQPLRHQPLHWRAHVPRFVAALEYLLHVLGLVVDEVRDQAPGVLALPADVTRRRPQLLIPGRQKLVCAVQGAEEQFAKRSTQRLGHMAPPRVGAGELTTRTAVPDGPPQPHDRIPAGRYHPFVTTLAKIDPALQPVLPLTASVNAAGHLEVGGCDAVALASEFGTPLYVFDEADLRTKAHELLAEFRSRWPDTTVLYAGKAYIGKALARVFAEEGLGLDVVSGGELAIAMAAGFPLDRTYFHGNSKLPSELREAVGAGIGRVVVDNFTDMRLLAEVAGALGRTQAVLLRVTPDVDAHTHAKITTGVLDSKFGLPVAFGQAEEAVRQIMASPSLDLVGIHCHIGSQIFELEPYYQAVEVALEFAGAMVHKHHLDFREFSPGGGIGLQYLRDEAPPAASVYAEAITGAVRDGCRRFGLPARRLVVEPGRAMVGRAGIALYTVGSRKELPEVRTYVAVDGGMADNIRPAMYGSKYEALSAERAAAPAEETVTVVGKYCESGDYLIRDARLPRMREGEVLAIPAAGAYCLAMASNYNGALRPPVVFVRDGKARLVRRRETYQDLLATEVD